MTYRRLTLLLLLASALSGCAKTETPHTNLPPVGVPPPPPRGGTYQPARAPADPGK